MKVAILMGSGVLSLAMSGLRPAYGFWEVQGRAPVALPECVGERAAIILNRALDDSEQPQALRIQVIDDGHQTDFSLPGIRSCEGSMVSRAGRRYSGTWSYTRVDDTLIRVRFSLWPSAGISYSMSPAAAGAGPEMFDDAP